MKIIAGFHSIEEALRAGKTKGIIYLTGKNKRHEKIRSLAYQCGVKTVAVRQPEIDRIAGGIDCRGVVFVLSGSTAAGGGTAPAGGGGTAAGSLRDKKKAPPGAANPAVAGYPALAGFLKNFDNESALVLMLDSITDPHNFGAILRSADQFCADLVIVPSRRSAGETLTVRKTSAGAVEYVNITEENLSRSIDLLKKKGFWIYGADMNGTDIRKADLKGKTAIVMGSEGKGVSRLLLEKCDGIIKIPAAGHVDSFNVSVAAGIIMYETRRQQNFIMPA